MFTCPVCYFENMPDPPADFNICPCCGTEFGIDDESLSFTELRGQWVADGSRWFYGSSPEGWRPWRQLQGVVVLGGEQNYPVSLATSTDQKSMTYIGRSQSMQFFTVLDASNSGIFTAGRADDFMRLNQVGSPVIATDSTPTSHFTPALTGDYTIESGHQVTMLTNPRSASGQHRDVSLAHAG
jgi:hypothetical protein